MSTSFFDDDLSDDSKFEAFDEDPFNLPTDPPTTGLGDFDLSGLDDLLNPSSDLSNIQGFLSDLGLGGTFGAPMDARTILSRFGVAEEDLDKFAPLLNMTLQAASGATEDIGAFREGSTALDLQRSAVGQQGIEQQFTTGTAEAERVQRASGLTSQFALESEQQEIASGQITADERLSQQLSEAGVARDTATSRAESQFETIIGRLRQDRGNTLFSQQQQLISGGNPALAGGFGSGAFDQETLSRQLSRLAGRTGAAGRFAQQTAERDRDLSTQLASNIFDVQASGANVTSAATQRTLADAATQATGQFDLSQTLASDIFGTRTTALAGEKELQQSQLGLDTEQRAFDLEQQIGGLEGDVLGGIGGGVTSLINSLISSGAIT